ncbi:MAG: ABC transporter permease [Flavobacteriales bacterium]|nr:ABC transporter permease [Flavobacteriales bacterium]NNK81339.1 ABC transporter permease [Flavobacteriales bacterium]
MNKVWLIIQREYLTRVKKKSFIIMTILGPLLFVAFIGGAFYLSIKDSKEYDVILTDSEGMFGKTLFEDDFTDSKQIHYHVFPAAMSDIAFKESDYDLKIDITPELIYARSVNMYYKEQPGVLITEQVADMLERNFERMKLERENIDQEMYESLTTPIRIVKFDIDNVDKGGVDTELGAGIGFAMAIMIFLFIVLYGSQIMRGVMEEKTSRIVEVLVSSVKPFQLMLGKIIGVAMVGLTQFLLWVILSSVLMTVAQLVIGDAFVDPGVVLEQQMSSDVKNEMIGAIQEQGDSINAFWGIIHQINFPFIIGMFIFFFLGGYLLYGALFAAIGSSVDSETDSQQFMMPMMTPLMFGYIISALAFSNPSSSVLYWCSIIPFTSPVVMMIRVGMMGMGYEAIDWLSIGISMILLIAGFIFTTWLAGRIYRIGILMYGKKVSYKELWKWIRYY